MFSWNKNHYVLNSNKHHPPDNLIRPGFFIYKHFESVQFNDQSSDLCLSRLVDVPCSTWNFCFNASTFGFASIPASLFHMSNSPLPGILTDCNLSCCTKRFKNLFNTSSSCSNNLFYKQNGCCRTQTRVLGLLYKNILLITISKIPQLRLYQ